MRRIFLSITLALSLTLAATACAPTSEPVALDAGTLIIDVRTPAEFASGHLEGAVNIDVQSADFCIVVLLEHWDPSWRGTLGLVPRQVGYLRFVQFTHAYPRIVPTILPTTK